MKERRWFWIGALLTTLALLGAACGEVEEEPTDGAAVLPGEGVTLSIAVNPWVGSAANANVAKVLLEQELGYTVELVEIDEFAQFPALSTGDLDATLEVWPSGHAKDYKRYIEGSQGVVDGGELGVIGEIGWWIPSYMLEENPELATWEGLKGNESLFATAETGDQGQILDGDPSFVTFDQPIADNLGLDLEVVYAGSEAAQLAALDAAYQNEDPFLFYFWTPHWAQEKYDLTRIELPEVTEACQEAAAGDASKYTCDYPVDVLYKAFNADLGTRAPAAFAFLSGMGYTNEDQNGVGLEISAGTDGEAAAQAWIDANPTVWQPWVDAGLAAES